MKLLKTIIVLMCSLLASVIVFAECSEDFSWLPNTEVDLAGYIIYYGEQNNEYPYSTDVGNPATIDGRCNGTVPELTCGRQYYFVCVAVNDDGVESLYSDQVAVPKAGAPSAPKDFKIVAKI